MEADGGLRSDMTEKKSRMSHFPPEILIECMPLPQRSRCDLPDLGENCFNCDEANF
jgi:hypothetical protein